MKNKIKDLETLLNESKLDQEMRNILEELNEESELSTNDAPKVVEEGEPEEKSLHANNSDIEDMNDEEKTEDVDVCNKDKEGAEVMTEELKVNDAPEVVKPEAEEPKPVEATNADIEKMNDEEKTEDVKEVVIEEVDVNKKNTERPDLRNIVNASDEKRLSNPQAASVNQPFSGGHPSEELTKKVDPKAEMKESEDPVLEDVVEPVTPEVETAEAKGYGDGEVVEHTHEVCPVCGKCKCKPGECECPEDERCKCEEVVVEDANSGIDSTINQWQSGARGKAREQYDAEDYSVVSSGGGFKRDHEDEEPVTGSSNPGKTAEDNPSAQSEDPTLAINIEDSIGRGSTGYHKKDRKTRKRELNILKQSFKEEVENPNEQEGVINVYNELESVEQSLKEMFNLLTEEEELSTNDAPKVVGGENPDEKAFSANNKDIEDMNDEKYADDVEEVMIESSKAQLKWAHEIIENPNSTEADKLKAKALIYKHDIGKKASEKMSELRYMEDIGIPKEHFTHQIVKADADAAIDTGKKIGQLKKEAEDKIATTESVNYSPKVVGGENPDEKAFSANNKDIEDMNDEKYADDVEEVLVESIDANIKLFEILDECGYDLTSENYNTLRTAILNRNTLNESVLLEELTRNDSPDVVSTKDPVEVIWKLNNKDLFPQDMSADDVEEVLVEMEEMYSDYEFLTSMEDDEVDCFVESLNYDDAKYYESLLEDESIELFESLKPYNSIDRLNIYNTVINEAKASVTSDPMVLVGTKPPKGGSTAGEIAAGAIGEGAKESAKGGFIGGLTTALSNIGNTVKKGAEAVGNTVKKGAEAVAGSTGLGSVVGYGVPAALIAGGIAKGIQEIRKAKARKKYGKKLVAAMEKHLANTTDENKKAKIQQELDNVKEYIKDRKTRREEKRKLKVDLRNDHTTYDEKTGKSKFNRKAYKEELKNRMNKLKIARRKGKGSVKEKMSREDDKPDRSMGRKILDVVNPLSTRETRIGNDEDREVKYDDSDVEKIKEKTNEAFNFITDISELLIENDIPVTYENIVDLGIFLEDNDYIEFLDNDNNVSLIESISYNKLDNIDLFIENMCNSENLSESELETLRLICEDNQAYELLYTLTELFEGVDGYARFEKRYRSKFNKIKGKTQEEIQKYADTYNKNGGKNNTSGTAVRLNTMTGSDRDRSINPGEAQQQIDDREAEIEKRLDQMKKNSKNMGFGHRRGTLTKQQILIKAKEAQKNGKKYGKIAQLFDGIKGRVGWGEIGKRVSQGVENFKNTQEEHKKQIKDLHGQIKDANKKYKKANKNQNTVNKTVEKYKDIDDKNIDSTTGAATFETYTNESINLDWTYYDTEEKVNILSEQVAFTIANDNSDRLFEELVEATAKANRLYEAVLNKYFEVGQERAISILEELAANDAPEVVEEGEPEEKSFSATNADIKNFNDEEDSDDVEEVIVKESIMEFLKESEYEESEENVSLIESAMRGEIVLDEGIISDIVKKSLIKKHLVLQQLYDSETDLEKKDRIYNKMLKLQDKMANYGIDVGRLFKPMTESELSTNDSPKVVEEGKPEEKAFSADNKDIEKMNSEKKSDDVEEVIVENKVRVAKTPSETSYR